MVIQKFIIKGFQGKKSLEVDIENNKLILVSENGAGKTTLLRLIYLFLSKQWNKLVDCDFDEIIATIDAAEYTFKKDDYRSDNVPKSVIDTLVKEYPMYEEFFSELTLQYTIDDLLNSQVLVHELESKFDVPISLVADLIGKLEKYQFDSNVYKWKGSVLYLPTYRRIERNFDALYDDLGKRLAQHIRQAVPEVDKLIKEELEEGYSITENDMLTVFETLWQKRDTDRWSDKGEDFHMELIEFGIKDVQYRLKVQEASNNFRAIQHYLQVCNNYLTFEKRLVFSKNLGLVVAVPDSDKTMPLDILSAGEKQIISIFSYLITYGSDIFLIIDEPELSLSMTWQEMLLSDIISFNVNGLIVATHSPFIVSAMLKDYTHGINEFEYE